MVRAASFDLHVFLADFAQRLRPSFGFESLPRALSCLEISAAALRLVEAVKCTLQRPVPDVGVESRMQVV
jgi:hypothetical protein